MMSKTITGARAVISVGGTPIAYATDVKLMNPNEVNCFDPTIEKMVDVAKNQLKQIKEGTLPKHKHLVTDVNFLEKFIEDNDDK